MSFNSSSMYVVYIVDDELYQYNFYYKLYKPTINIIVQANGFKVKRCIVVCVCLGTRGFW